MSNDQLFKSGFLFGVNAAYLERLYVQYLQDKNSIGKDWQEIFKNLNEQNSEEAIKSIQTRYNFYKETKQKSATENSMITQGNYLLLQVKMLVDAYRNRGHFLAKLDPLEMEVLPTENDLKLDLAYFNITEQHLDTVVEIDRKISTIRDLVKRLKLIYCTNIAYEFSHINNYKQIDWLINRIENYQEQNELTDNDRKSILASLIEVESFEQFLHTKFPSTKRFSIEGGDNSIVATEWAIKTAALDDVSDVVIGMAHRGRLNSLTKIMQKSYVSMFSEFHEGSVNTEELDISGDVKYHTGYSSDVVTSNKKVHLSLVANPSHLEAVNSVVAGKVRAKQDLLKDNKRHSAMGLLLHGDASFSGQGVVLESLMLSDLDGYGVGGIIHIIINNQVGFTASAKKGRASRYPSEAAKAIEAPIFHINGNNAEEIVKASKIATEYRNRFGKDVVLNIVCYRLHGHNEMDEPRFTQPVMYKKISLMSTPGKIYADQLSGAKVIDDEYYHSYKEAFKDKLEKDLATAKYYKSTKVDWFEQLWAKFSYFNLRSSKDFATGVKTSKLKELGLKLSHVPDGFALNAKISRQLEAKKQMIQTGQGIDWATGESLAFASLLVDSIGVRLSGQDSGRGTFSHRHSVFVNQENEAEYVPLNNLAKSQGYYEVIDSNLSEYAVMGFEYGYSTVNPNQLVLWESQFGDFANGAQIIIDQFIAAAEVKWMRSNGLVLLLPHGYEGQGPEHSSARLERFLQLCAEDNMQVVNCTTPASYFHALRRQIYRDYRKPLIVMTPKSTLRHKLNVSSIAEFDEGKGFQSVLPEASKMTVVKRLILCSGKVYYDLQEYRDTNKVSGIALVRLEQLYPFPKKLLQEELKKYQGIEIIWCQEEPENMGAWRFLQPLISYAMLELGFKSEIKYIGRQATASTAVGSHAIHSHEQEALIKQAINL